MKQKIFFLHSAGPQDKNEGSSGFLASLIADLQDSYEIVHPVMPNPENPDYEPWKEELDRDFSHLAGDVILIGHSLGGSVLIKYISENKVNFNIIGLFLCAAPFWGVDKDWQYEPFALASNFADKINRIDNLHMYHSLGDPIVEFKHAQRYKHELPNAKLHSLDGSSHVFESGVPELVDDIKASPKHSLS